MKTPSTIPDFYLASSEGYDLEIPRKCFVIKRTHSDRGDDFLLVSIDPPIIGQKHGLGDKDIDQIILATRHQGDSFFPIKNFPLPVHVARILIDNPQDKDFIHNYEMKLIAWAEIYNTNPVSTANAPRP